MFGKTSLGTVGLIVGGILSVVGIGAYFADYATLNLAGFFYGIPLLLGGLALKAAELKPIPFTKVTSEEVLAIREEQATPIQNQLRKDVTRYRYGQKAHLDETLKRFKLSPTDEERPVLVGVRETLIDGNYALILEFDSPKFSLEVWQEKEDKITTFFGPNVRAEVTQPSENRIDLALIKD